MRKTLLLILSILVLFCTSSVFGENYNDFQPYPTDVFEFYIDHLIEAYPGQHDLLIPLQINTTQPAVGINVTLEYDPSLIDPLVIAPNFFYQSFIYDLSQPGEITINALTDLPPPPEVPPVLGDTVFAWLLCRVIAEDPGYDVLTDLTFMEDPYTPYPDNSLLLENGGWVTPPNLVLTSGDILIFHPLYGDLNLNGFVYEIGDAVVFMNYFIGIVEFNARQYANSDCNRDGIQASIADLVYMLCVVSGDTILVNPPPIFPDDRALATNENFSQNSLKTVDNMASYDINVNGSIPLGGACFVFDYDPYEIEPVAVLLDSSASPLELGCEASEGKLKVMIYNWNPSSSVFSSGHLFRIVCSERGESGRNGLSVSKAEFSDTIGSMAEFDYSVDYSRPIIEQTNLPSDISITTYPNPFNSTVAISYNILTGSQYNLSVFDILGRKVKTLADGYFATGENMIYWDGTDEGSSHVASGIYFIRLSGGETSAVAKVFLMK